MAVGTPVGGTPNQPRTRVERETVIIFNEAETDASLWTASLREANKWLKLGLAVAADNGGWRSKVTKSAVKVRNPFSRRALSPEHKAALVRGRANSRLAPPTSPEITGEAR